MFVHDEIAAHLHEHKICASFLGVHSKNEVCSKRFSVEKLVKKKIFDRDSSRQNQVSSSRDFVEKQSKSPTCVVSSLLSGGGRISPAAFLPP